MKDPPTSAVLLGLGMPGEVNTSEIQQAACLHGHSDFGLNPDRFLSVFYCCLDLSFLVKAAFV